ncbi:Phospholipase B-like 1 [Galemys pyrenaicus]|uniref:Phospholipase B-like n=1 Tax=Galemys pyrenaicus TaxID=202257 RepID=A0A8J6A1V0_GALPY|nr:Phospholipase B-like 1 [Galemys pyrenaicus]
MPRRSRDGPRGLPPPPLLLPLLLLAAAAPSRAASGGAWRSSLLGAAASSCRKRPGRPRFALRCCRKRAEIPVGVHQWKQVQRSAFLQAKGHHLIKKQGMPVKEVHYATAYWMPAEKTVQVKSVLDRNGDAYGFYNDSVMTTGWGVLEIRAGYGSQDLSNDIIMFVAGFLEGYLTASWSRDGIIYGDENTLRKNRSVMVFIYHFRQMYDHFTNLYPQLIKKPSIVDKVQEFMEYVSFHFAWATRWTADAHVIFSLRKQDQWTRDKIKNSKDDPFWRHTGYVMAQFDGLYVGAMKRAVSEGRKPMTIFQIQFLNAVGDLLDLIPSLSPTKNSTLKVFKRWDMGHCSALIKVLPGFENLYFAHSSWYTYAAMLRIYKHWDFNIKDRNTSSCRLSFSSYPGESLIEGALTLSTSSGQNHDKPSLRAADGFVEAHGGAATRAVGPPHLALLCGRALAADGAHRGVILLAGFLESLDDFYILSSGLVLLQTTNSVYNKTLLKYVVPQSLLAWQRVRVANMMASGGKEWAEIFTKYNSGTYNNQYMILDLKKVKLKNSLDKGALYIVEQIPTYVEFSEQTDVLRKGYWPSYNIPFHEKIYNWSGYPLLVKKLGLDYSYDLSSRAKIFRRDQGRVTDMESMKYIMRYNNYEKDPYSEGDPCNTICCREDLNALNPSPGGCYDTKVSDISLASENTAYAISGPTVQGGLPVFHWNRFNKTLHEGMPEAYNFGFMIMKPTLTGGGR